MGSPEFAVHFLAELQKRHEVVTVVTAPDKPAGRGHGMQMTAVKRWALEKGLTVLQPASLKTRYFKEELRASGADVAVVVAFRILPLAVLDIPRLGSVNVHASLLPQYRGAAPIQRAIMAGESLTGLTVFQLNSGVDTGCVLGQLPIPIPSEMTGGELHDVMARQGPPFLLSVLEDYENGKLSCLPQDDSKASFAPKIFREDCRIDWGTGAKTVLNQIRALSPYPCAWFVWNDFEIKIITARPASLPCEGMPGSLFIANKRLYAFCADGCIELLRIKPPGKQVMDGHSFANGYPVERRII
ncbi:MAG: methionyl-tRNA formyltransferase [Saprospiraceae bacterium]|jgi:methionyl-tRNA formyltransferase|nr:methionyl-tRNA formyltransferase [Saprospiraceae bacterium]MBP9209682.1 methionyl-tRNA formyltransferase [Saprospiraceae bacterium]MBV6471957.1 Methionyl-tRNA formyltransferase [Saprospiraceae bacterium]